jgi:hypothetical protein
MHSNCGITFDLHALRAKYPNKRAVRFRAIVGNLESKLEAFVADAWVLVDGELRYRREAFSREDGPDTIDIPLSDRDRFLVLAVTDSGRNTAYDWVAFGDPLIELTDSGETSASSDSPPTVNAAAVSYSPTSASMSHLRRLPVISNSRIALVGVATR